MKLLIATTLLALVATIYGNPIQSGKVTGEIISNDDGTVKLIATVTGGNPPANTFTWRLPDNSVINSGESRGSFQSSASAVIGKSTHTLVLKNGYTSSQQVITFKAQSSWWATYTFTLGPKRSNGAPRNTDYVMSTLGGDTEFNSDGSVTLLVTVTGGHPSPNHFQWTLADGTTLRPGQNSGSNSARYPRFNSDGTRTYGLHLGSGLSSSPQRVTFRVETVDRWWREFYFNLPAKRTIITRSTGSVRGSGTIQKGGVIIVEAEVVGGHPAPNNYLWTVQRPDGSFVEYQPGQGPTSHISTNSRGNPSTTLRITSSSRRSRQFKLYVTSESNGNLNWWASRTWNFPSTA